MVSDLLIAYTFFRMGAYEEYMKSLQAAGMGPLRPVEVEPQAKPHAFGNPFKIDKKNMSIIDEVINSKSANTLIWFKATSSKVLIHKSVCASSVILGTNFVGYRLFLEQTHN